MYKNSLDEDLPFMTLNMTRRIPNPTFTVPTAYSGPLPITQEKKMIS